MTWKGKQVWFRQCWCNACGRWYILGFFVFMFVVYIWCSLQRTTAFNGVDCRHQLHSSYSRQPNRASCRTGERNSNQASPHIIKHFNKEYMHNSPPPLAAAIAQQIQCHHIWLYLFQALILILVVIYIYI